VKLTKLNLGWPIEPLFLVPEEAGQHFRLAINNGCEMEAEWNGKFAGYGQQYPELASELRQLMRGELPTGWDADIPQFPADVKGMATRIASGKVLASIASKLPGLMEAQLI